MCVTFFPKKIMEILINKHYIYVFLLVLDSLIQRDTGVPPEPHQDWTRKELPV